MRSARVWPDLSSASARVSETVSTAMLSGMNCLGSLVEDIKSYLLSTPADVILRCAPCGASAPQGEPRRMGRGLRHPSRLAKRRAPQDDATTSEFSDAQLRNIIRATHARNDELERPTRKRVAGLHRA